MRLDQDASSITRFSTGRVMAIREYCFSPAVIGEATVFKLPELPRAHVFVTDPFVERVKRDQLHGFEFRLLWSSDAGSESKT